jgi:ubiquinol-cytochrome c reductase cytochrome b subunit
VRKQEISPIHELFENMPPTRRKIPFLPDQVYFEIAAIALLTFGLIFINQYIWNAKLESHANPFVTPQHTRAPWYFLFLQGMLKVGDKFFFGLLLFGLMFAALTALPYLDRNPSRKFKDRKVALAGAAVAMILIGFLTYAGLAVYGIQETATSELVFEWVPGEGEGKPDHVPFDQLPNQLVIWDSAANGRQGGFVAGDPSQLSPEAQVLFEEFQDDVEFWLEHDEPFKKANGSATLRIAPWQTDTQGVTTLKKITLQLVVDGRPQPEATRFLSRDKDKLAQ